MNKQSYLHFSIGAVSLLLIDLVLAVPAAANPPPNPPSPFSCRASALRVDELFGQIFEPVVANPPEDPCATDAKSLVSIGPPPLLGIISTNLVSAETVAAPPPASLPVTAEGKVVGLNILGLVTAGVLDAKARVDSVKGSCVLSSTSTVTSALVLGAPVVVIGNHLNIPIPLVGVVHFNETLGGLHPTSGPPNPNKVTQRALWLEITNPLLQQITGVKQVIAGEATADVSARSPCHKGKK